MLTMSSAAPLLPAADRTGRARIRDAAIARFADRGVAGTSLKVIAEDAGVSQPLVVHHFGTKQGLRAACDEHVAAVIRQRKLAVVEQGAHFDPLAAMRGNEQTTPLLRYLARTLGDGSPQVVALLDEMVEDAVEYMAEGVRTGMIKPSEHPRGRAVVLVLWSLGALTLHEHLDRLLGVDLTAEPEDLSAYVLPAAEILANGVLAEGVYERVRDALTNREEGSS